MKKYFCIISLLLATIFILSCGEDKKRPRITSVETNAVVVGDPIVATLATLDGQVADTLVISNTAGTILATGYNTNSINTELSDVDRLAFYASRVGYKSFLISGIEVKTSIYIPAILVKEGIETGKIRFDGRPEETSIFINDGFIGLIPTMELELPVGKYRAEARKVGWHAQTDTVTIVKDSTKTHWFFLEPVIVDPGKATGTLSIDVVPANARIDTLGDSGTRAPFCTGSCQDVTVPAGTYTLYFETVGYIDTTLIVTVAENQPATTAMTMREKPGKIVINSLTGAVIRFPSLSPQEKVATAIWEDVPAGNYKGTVELMGYHVAHLDIYVDPGHTVQLYVSLIPDVGPGPGERTILLTGDIVVRWDKSNERRKELGNFPVLANANSVWATVRLEAEQTAEKWQLEFVDGAGESTWSPVYEDLGHGDKVVRVMGAMEDTSYKVILHSRAGTGVNSVHLLLLYCYK